MPWKRATNCANAPLQPVCWASPMLAADPTLAQTGSLVVREHRLRQRSRVPLGEAPLGPVLVARLLEHRPRTVAEAAERAPVCLGDVEERARTRAEHRSVRDD